MQQATDQYNNPARPAPIASLLDSAAIIIKYSRMIAGFTLVATLLSIIIVLLLPGIYTAKTLIIPSDDDKGAVGALMSQLGGLAGMAGGAIGAKSTGDLYITMLKSESIKDPIIDRFKLLDLYKVKFRTDAYKALDKNAVITLGKKDGVISIAVDDKDPKRAADLANAYVEELGKLAAGLNMTGAGKNRVFLEKRIAETRADLNRAEEALKEFQSKNKSISVTDQARATIEGVAQLRAQLAIKEVELGTLQRQYTENSQEVKSAKTVVANLRAQITGLEGKGHGGSSSIPNVGNLPQLGQLYLRLMRDFKIQEAVLEMLTKQFEATKMSEVKDQAPFQVLQKAKTQERKSKPARRKIIILTMLLSLFVSSSLAITLEMFRNLPEPDRKRWRSITRREYPEES